MNGQKDERQRKGAFRRYSEEYRLNAAKMVIQRGHSPTGSPRNSVVPENLFADGLRSIPRALPLLPPRGYQPKTELTIGKEDARRSNWRRSS